MELSCVSCSCEVDVASRSLSSFVGQIRGQSTIECNDTSIILSQSNSISRYFCNSVESFQAEHHLHLPLTNVSLQEYAKR